MEWPCKTYFSQCLQKVLLLFYELALPKIVQIVLHWKHPSNWLVWEEQIYNGRKRQASKRIKISLQRRHILSRSIEKISHQSPDLNMKNSYGLLQPDLVWNDASCYHHFLILFYFEDTSDFLVKEIEPLWFWKEKKISWKFENFRKLRMFPPIPHKDGHITIHSKKECLNTIS